MGLISTYKYLQVGAWWTAQALFHSVQLQNKGQRAHRLERRKFHVNMRNNFFTLSILRHWSRLPRAYGVSSGGTQKSAGCFPLQPNVENLL